MRYGLNHLYGGAGVSLELSPDLDLDRDRQWVEVDSGRPE